MARKLRVVLVDWVDGEVADTDEIRVFADDDTSAICRAKDRWLVTKGAKWPHCRIEKLEILAPARRRGFA